MLTRAAPGPPKELKRANRRTLALIILIALVFRLAVTPFPNFENLMDADHIHAWEPGNMARSLVAGRGFGSTLDAGQPSAMMAPVYPLIVAGFFLLFGVHTAQSILAIHIFDCVINALACIPIFLLTRNSFGERVARWSTWGWAIFPYGIYFSAAWAWGTHLLLLGLCWLLYMAQKMEHSPRLGLWAGFGLLAGITGLTEPSVLVVIPFLMALAAWRLAREGNRWLLPGLMASLALAATLSPWMIRNAMVFHRFIPMRDNMGLETWVGNNGHDLRWTDDQDHPLHDRVELADYNSMGELAYMDRKAQQAGTYIHGHPALYAWMCVRRAVFIWTGYWSFDREYLALEPMDPANIPFATCLTLLGILGLLVAWREAPNEAIRYGGVLFLFPIMYYFSHPEPYDLRPLDPLMLMLGCYAVYELRGSGRERALLPSVAQVLKSQLQTGTDSNAAPELALVIPTLCEAENIAVTLDRVRAVLDQTKLQYEIVVVDDDSPDATEEIVSAIAAVDPRVRLVVRKGERGVAGATLLGWQSSNAPILGVIDADLQHPPEMLAKLVSAVLNGCDLAVGSRYAADGGLGDWHPVRKMISLAALSVALPVQKKQIRVKDPTSGLFMLRRECIEGVRFQKTGFKLLLEILVRGHAQSVTEIPYTFGPRARGESKATFKVAFHYALLLSRLYWARFGLHFPGRTAEPAYAEDYGFADPEAEATLPAPGNPVA